MPSHAAIQMVRVHGEEVNNKTIACPKPYAGFTDYLENGGSIQKARQIAANESPKSTKLDDRTSDQITLDKVEWIVI
jgi:hypothetical protein